jgi:hypothetical protein
MLRIDFVCLELRFIFTIQYSYFSLLRAAELDSVPQKEE